MVTSTSQKDKPPYPSMSIQTLCVCVDASVHSRNALRWAVQYLWHPDNVLHLVTVVPSLAKGIISVDLDSNNKCKVEDDFSSIARESLEPAVSFAVTCGGVPASRIRCYMLASCSGATGVGEAIVNHAEEYSVSILVCGSRGWGSIKRNAMCVVGLGSVSCYAVAHAPCPVVLVRRGAQTWSEDPMDSMDADCTMRDSQQVMLCTDFGPISHSAVTWATSHIIQPQDNVHVVTVGMPAPLPSLISCSPQFSHSQLNEWQEQNRQHVRNLQDACAGVAAQVRAESGVQDVHQFHAVLPDAADTTQVGSVICGYAASHPMGVVVLGSPCKLQTCKVGTMPFGVGQYCVENLECDAVVVVKCVGESHEGSDDGQGGVGGCTTEHNAKTSGLVGMRCSSMCSRPERVVGLCSVNSAVLESIEEERQ